MVYQGMSWACGSLLTVIHRERIGRRKKRVREREREEGRQTGKERRREGKARSSK